MMARSRWNPLTRRAAAILLAAFWFAAAAGYRAQAQSATVRLVVDYCDGWIPIGMRSGDLPTEIGALHRLARENGRDPRTISVNVYGVPADREVLVRLRDAGATRAVFSLPPAGPEKVLPLLDRFADTAR